MTTTTSIKVIKEQDEGFFTLRQNLRPLMSTSQMKDMSLVAVGVRSTGEMELVILTSEEIPRVVNQVNWTFWGLFLVDRTFLP